MAPASAENGGSTRRGSSWAWAETRYRSGRRCKREGDDTQKHSAAKRGRPRAFLLRRARRLSLLSRRGGLVEASFRERCRLRGSSFSAGICRSLERSSKSEKQRGGAERIAERQRRGAKVLPCIFLPLSIGPAAIADTAVCLSPLGDALSVSFGVSHELPAPVEASPNRAKANPIAPE